MNTKQSMRKFLNRNRMNRKVAYRVGRGIPVLVTEFVEATSLVPNGWEEWFWGIISEDAPFSWGDNNRTFCTAYDFASYCEKIMDLSTAESTTSGARREWLKKIYRLGQMPVDLEN